MSSDLPVNVAKTTVVRRAGSLAKGAAKAANPLAALEACIEYAKIAEQERTERQRIKAQCKVAVEAIHAQKDAILKFFDMYFTERREALEQFFKELDEGMRTRDDKLLDGALHGIVAIVKENPLKDLAVFQQNMKKSGFQLEL